MIEERSYYLRDPDIIAIGTAGRYLFVDRSGAVNELATACTAAWSALLQDLFEPMRGEKLRARLAEFEPTDAEMLASMLEKGLLVRSADAEMLGKRCGEILINNHGYHLERGEAKCEHLVIALTGSIVAGLMSPVVLSLAYCGYQRRLDLILTETALKFATRDFFESYGIRTWVSPFERRDGIHVVHVSLGGSANCILVMPATANALCRIADGACTDLLSLTVAATTAPVVMVPAMNAVMWSSPAVRRNVEKLRKDGIYVVEPSLIFKATNVQEGDVMYGGPGTFWRGALGVSQTLSAAIAHKRKSLLVQERPRATNGRAEHVAERPQQIWPCAGVTSRQMFGR